MSKPGWTVLLVVCILFILAAPLVLVGGILMLTGDHDQVANVLAVSYFYIGIPAAFIVGIVSIAKLAASEPTYIIIDQNKKI
jgi:undecaprenyl pyrophosphate phosphatase UppP